MRVIGAVILLLGAIQVATAGQGGKRVIEMTGEDRDTPTSAAVVAGDYVYVSGQFGREPDGSFGDIKTQTRRALDNISAILQELQKCHLSVVAMPFTEGHRCHL